MLLQIFGEHERLFTDVTCLRLVPLVVTYVSTQVTAVGETLATDFTRVRFLSCVYANVTVVVMAFTEHLATVFTFVSFEGARSQLFLGHVLSDHVRLQGRLHFKSFATVFTHVFRVVCVHRLMIT